jgi:hypothetical protein
MIKSEGSNHSDDLDVDGSIIVKYIEIPLKVVDWVYLA